MTGPGRLIRQTLTIARRDFVATVFTPTFLIFLLAPVFMLSFGAIGGLGAASVAGNSIKQIRIFALAAPEQARALQEADVLTRRALRGDALPPPLVIHPVTSDDAAAARRLLRSREVDVSAVLHGPLDRPTIVSTAFGRGSGDYLALLAETALRAERGGFAGPLSQATRESFVRERASRSAQQGVGFAAVFIMFILTLFLAGQTVGTMAEERTNKVIEVLAAAVPLEAVFFGKLVGMFGVALVFVAFWGLLGSQGAWLLPPDALRGLAAAAPAVGTGTFAILFLVYFMMAFLLLGSVFLSIGAQAGTMREIQMLSLPLTIFQIAMLGLSSAAAGAPGTTLALVAEVLPFSSPFAMAAHAANRAELWPHLAAIAWQLLWLAISIAVGARAFRRGVLQSGSPRWRRGRTDPAQG